MKKNKGVYLTIMVLILAVGAVLRLAWLDKSPYSVNFDEAAVGYNTYSLLKTGRDEYGYRWPLSLRSFNDYKPALYSYLSIPFVALLGLNNISIRLVSALSGLVSLGVLYLLLGIFIKNKWGQLIIWGILSMEPWRIHFSRTALETNLSMALFISGAYVLLTIKKNKLRKQKMKLAGLILLLSLSAYAYHSARVVVPILLFLWIIDPIDLLYKKRFWLELKEAVIRGWKLFGLLILFLLLTYPIIKSVDPALLLTRFRQENLFERYAPYAPKELLTNGSTWANWRNNPVYYLGALLSGHVVSYISPINLSLRVYHWVERSVQSIPDMGMIGWWEGIVFVFGLVYLLGRLKKDFNCRVLLYWLIAAVLPAAVTWNWFHPLRSLNAYPVIELMVALGLMQIYQKVASYTNGLTKNLVLGLAGGLMVLTMVFVINNELVYGAWKNNGEYQPGGFKKGVPILNKLQSDYNQVIIDSPHAQSYIFFLFYQSFDPRIVQRYASVRPASGIEGNLNFDFWKYKFVDRVDWRGDKEKESTIFWTSREVIDAEIEQTAGAELLRVKNVLGNNAAAIITKE